MHPQGSAARGVPTCRISPPLRAQLAEMSAFLDVEAPADRYQGVTRPYTEQDVLRLRGSLKIEHTLAKVGGCVGR